ncbi:Cytochrome c-type biogenesis protein CcmH precursor [Microbulbifer aggregans]|uniref:Cytochrome c-type biogenesis protein n=1 Tax=Microbulbifer aggregans TaxID=1769779 RepID=A0A1C9W8Y5_9GAMM|nr:cytochrome c-type biogenesis protein [Microbulbifer aggregans]AOS97619.1 Cytochrome c-type biogenesis protein CcmH precursor [Microbulbifer aggregans]
MRPIRWSAHFAAALFALCLAVSAGAAVDAEPLSSPELEARYKVLIEEMRCPKCQNQNLAGSDSPVANDLRREIRRLLEEGFSDAEITEYMVARYGDFVLYRPPLQRNTVALWLAPGVFAALGLLALVVIVVRSRSGRGAAQEEANPGLTDDERRRLQQLLGTDTDDLNESEKNRDD